MDSSIPVNQASAASGSVVSEAASAQFPSLTAERNLSVGESVHGIEQPERVTAETERTAAAAREAGDRVSRDMHPGYG